MGEIVGLVQDFGFNCVRLVFSNELFVADPNISADVVAANPTWAGRRATEIFDATVTALTNAGVMVVLNDHVSTAQWCCSLTDGQGLWYTKAFPATQWQSMWVDLARRYKDNVMVIGA